MFFWVSLATSWSFLSGYAGYFSFGHGAFFGAGVYTTATLTAGFGVPFLASLPAAGAVAALLAAGIGAVVFRVRRLRGELFGLLTLAITFVLATIVLNTRIDGGPGVYLSAVPLPRLVASPTGTMYLLGARPRPRLGDDGVCRDALALRASGSSRSTTTRTSPRSRASPRSATSSRRSRCPRRSRGWRAGSTPST